MNPFLGQIVMFGGNFAPRGWAFCDGQLLSISSHSALFSILGTTYGGDGRTTFALPDLRGRASVHNGNGPGLEPVQLGEKGGANERTLIAQNVPSHTHTLRGSTGAANASSPTGAVPATVEDANRNPFNVYQSGAANTDMGSTAIAPNSGGSTPFSIMQPFTVVNYIIALEGTYPSRN